MSSRELVIHTGIGGMRAINTAMKEEARQQIIKAYMEDLDKLSDYDQVGYEQYDNIKEMLYSNDIESSELAMILIDTKNGGH